MRPLFGLYLCVFLLIAGGISGDCDNDQSAYLPIGWNSIEDHAIDWIVGQIDSGRWGNNAEMVAGALRRAIEEVQKLKYGEPIEDRTGIAGYKPKEGKSDNQRSFRELYWALRDFHNLALESVDQELVCTTGDVNFLVRIMNRKFGGVKALLDNLSGRSSGSPTLNYLRHYAPGFYSRCFDLLKDPAGAMLKRINVDAETEMDKLVSLGEHMGEDEADGRLVELAKRIDLAEGKLDAVKWLNLVRQQGHKEKRRNFLKVVDSGRLLADVFEDICSQMRYLYALPVYNMAKLLVPQKVGQVPVTAKFEKLNEYSRICRHFGAQRGRVRKNMVNNLVREAISQIG